MLADFASIPIANEALHIQLKPWLYKRKITRTQRDVRQMYSRSLLPAATTSYKGGLIRLFHDDQCNSE